MKIYISMRADEAIKILSKLALAAAEADGRDGHFEETIEAAHPPGTTIIFNNDDMERPEMTGKIIFDMEA